MYKRRIRTCISVSIVLGFIFLTQKNAAAQELVDSLLELPQVNIIACRHNEENILDKQLYPGHTDFIDDVGFSQLSANTGFLSAAFGRFNSESFQLMQSAKTKNFYHSFWFENIDSRGERCNGQFRVYDSGFRLGLPFDNQNELVLKMDYFDKIMGLPGRVNLPTSQDNRRTIHFKSAIQFNPKQGVSVEPYYDGASVNDALERPDYRSSIIGMKVAIKNDLFSADIHHYKTQLKNCYGQNNLDAGLRFVEMNFLRGYKLVLGSDLFYQQYFGERISPFAELILKKDQNCLHKFTLTREFEPLNFSQNYLEENYLEVNPDILRLERKFCVSYQIDKYIASRWLVNILFYAHQHKDMSFLADHDFNGLYAPRTLKKANSCGVKLAFEYSWNDDFSQFFSLDLNKIRSKDPDYEFVPFKPKQHFSSGFKCRIAEKFNIDIVGDYFGRRFYQGNLKETLGCYLLWKAKFSYDFKDNLQTFVLIDNLFNDYYEVVKGYP
ncbi:MAG: hypothetical protein DRP78_03135, partial [Candidatus Omnitrophota bacterium]